MESFDVVVVGGGPTGENVAGRVAAGGLSVALVEHEKLGGECSYWACMPSKVLLRPGEARQVARAVPGLLGTQELGISAKAAFARRDVVTHRLDDRSQVQWAEGAKITVVRGHGQLAGERRVQVRSADGTARELEAKRAVVLATGSRAAVPDIPGLRAARPWTNREATQARTVPRRLLVLGGGAVGVEMAQAFRALGSEEVTVVERGPRLLARMEPFAGEWLARALTAEGIRIRTGQTAKHVERGASGVVTLTLDGGETLQGDELLVALGRAPATADLGLDTVGLEPGGYVQVDDQLRVKGPASSWLYACGDVNGRNLLTHMGKYQARLCGDVILGKSAVAWADQRVVPQVLFTHPQIAAVGWTEEEARKRGVRVRAVEYALEDVAGTSVMGEGLTGRVKMVADAQRRVIVGMTLVGTEVGEMLQAATIAIAGEVQLERLWHAVPAYPTVSEFWLRLLEGYGI